MSDSNASTLILQESDRPSSITPATGFAAHAWMHQLYRAFSWIRKNVRTQQTLRTLKVRENVSLGDKRFVAVVQIDHERFLIAGAAGSINMLAKLEPDAFKQALQNSSVAGGQA
jgi:hypothetical protein